MSAPHTAASPTPVIVTGGGSGIGLAVAARCARAGTPVVICGRRPEILAAAATAIGPRVRWVRADVSDADDRAQLLAVAREAGGVGAIVHAAGDLVSGPVDQLTQVDATRVLLNNTMGALMLTGEAVADLERSAGNVVFFSSAHAGRAFANSAAYAASKGAVETMTRSLAAELAPRGIRVNCIRPGAVPTQIFKRAGIGPEAIAGRLRELGPKHALGRIGAPEEIADAVDYLLGAAWTTGSILTVDGGLTLAV